MKTVSKTLTSRATAPLARSVKTNRLSPREQQIIESRASGLTYKEISADLEISVNTLKSHLARSFRKLNVRSSLEAVHHIRVQLIPRRGLQLTEN